MPKLGEVEGTCLDLEVFTICSLSRNESDTLPPGDDSIPQVSMEEFLLHLGDAHTCLSVSVPKMLLKGDTLMVYSAWKTLNFLLDGEYVNERRHSLQGDRA